jgi:SAM-dependent methyltransferase
MIAPDSSAAGLLANTPEPLRYGVNTSIDEAEISGLMRALMPSGVRVLDVGSGAGGPTLAINRDKGNDVVCIEPDLDRSKAAAALGLCVYHGFFDETACRELGKFDVVVLADVLEHQASPADMLNLAKTCLNDHGIILASVPNVAHWTVRLALLFGKFDYQDIGIMDATHLRWFTQKTFCKLLETKGFVVEDLRFSAGAWMSVYNSGLMKWIPARIRRRAVIVLSRLAPRLYGCQLVVRGKLSEG